MPNVPAGLKLRGKRAFDVVGAGVSLVLAAPALAASMLAIYVTMGRPILFKQERPGYKGKPFTIWKLRTMRPARDGEDYIRTDSQRVTPVGRFLRRTSLDELPELWQVLTGDMSLVGPRPLLMEYLPKYTAEQRSRHDVRPGLTGWAVVHGRQLIPFSERLKLDVWYVDNWTFRLDLKIIAMTVRDVLKGEGDNPERSLEDVDDLDFAPHP